MRRLVVLRLGRMAYRWAYLLQHRLVEARQRDAIGDVVLVVEHPPTITLGRGGGNEDLRMPAGRLQRLGVALEVVDRGGRATYHGPGQLVLYPICRLGRDGEAPDAQAHAWRLEEAAIRCLAGFGIRAGRDADRPGVWVGTEKIAAVGLAVKGGVAYHGLALNVAPDLDHFALLVPCGLSDRGVTSLGRLLGRPPGLAEVERAFLEALAEVVGAGWRYGFGRAPWLAAAAPVGPEVEGLQALFRSSRLHTVCEAALCPNIAECWGNGTATFMILGDVCTRSCRFCAVAAGRPAPPDPLEPGRLAAAAASMGLARVVITSVARDDLPDGGAAHFAAAIRAVRRRLPRAAVEVLVPDFGGSVAALGRVLAEGPDVLGHNLETVPRLYPLVQPRKDYRRALAVLAWARRAGVTAKSGLMVGLGETRGEVVDVLRDLRTAGCDVVTLGQYLQPTDRQAPVAEYVHPVEFDWYREVALAMGFRAVTAGPLVRSSYAAEDRGHSVSEGDPDALGDVAFHPVASRR